MGEHLPCKQGVTSSNLVTSIRKHTNRVSEWNRFFICFILHLENCTLKKTSRIKNIQDIRGHIHLSVVTDRCVSRNANRKATAFQKRIRLIPAMFCLFHNAMWYNSQNLCSQFYTDYLNGQDTKSTGWMPWH